MRLPSSYRGFRYLTLLGLQCRLVGLNLLIACAASHAVDEGRLWLPVKYQSLHSSLIKAASAADEVDRCLVVAEGTLDLEQSKPEHPVFRILCRQENGRTYNEMVDGLSFATLTTPKKTESELFPDESEQFRLQKLDAWQQCRALLIEHTRLMQNLVWLRDLDTPPEPEFYSAEEIRYSISFDARSAWREPLHYVGQCIVRQGTPEVSLSKRLSRPQTSPDEPNGEI